ncbi:response regulator [bacterium]|nr:response regulator [bacterium]
MKNILIIDDEPKIREIYNKLLTEHGFKVFDAFNVRIAHKILMEEKIDLVLLDIKMPIVDGVSIFSLLKNSYENVKVIVTSVYSLEEQKKHIEGASDYFDKSQSIDKLLKKIATVLND